MWKEIKNYKKNLNAKLKFVLRESAKIDYRNI